MSSGSGVVLHPKFQQKVLSVDSSQAAAHASLGKVLATILDSFMCLCRCDGGAIYTVKHRDLERDSVLVFNTMITRSMRVYQVPEKLRSLEFALDETSLVGATALHRTFQHSSAEHHNLLLNYHVRNILSAPLVTPRGELVGVVQLLNKVADATPAEMPTEAASHSADFDERDKSLLSIVAGQASLAIENSVLLDEQEKLIEGFVNACVTAVEARDPVTSGHSDRVARYSIDLTHAINASDTGPMRDVFFNEQQVREIRFAAMLHDIGKISVKEDVLNKEKKLLPHQLEILSMRVRLMRSELRLIEAKTGASQENLLSQLEVAMDQILLTNEPALVAGQVAWVEQAVRKLEALRFTTFEGDELALLTPSDSERLLISRGSLTDSERREIQKHVVHTHEILSRVPWSRGLEKVPEIAHKHHEKLDGSGYPCRLHSEEIPIQSRILTICDIFDALTADDRPYKNSVPEEKALDILKAEVSQGKLDSEIFQVFLEARVFERARRVSKARRAA